MMMIPHTICCLAMMLVQSIWGAPIWEEKWVTQLSESSWSVNAPTIGRVSSWFGERIHPIARRTRHHDGIDIAAPRGTPIFASSPGIVTYAGWRGGYGRFVEVDHGWGWRSRYAHMNKLIVKRGERVESGQSLGSVGRTGYATGAHLHYELHYQGKPIDPMPFLAN